MKNPTIILLTISLLAVMGCSSGSDPLTVGEPETQYRADSAYSSSHNCLGYYKLLIEPDTGNVEVIPARSSELHINVVGILNASMGVGAAMVPGESDPANGLFALDITLAHPFPTKENFAGFDVRGILITPGSLSFSSLVFSDVGETILENADGYTRWWNPTEFTASGILGYTDGVLATAPAGALTATVNPYKLFADILDYDDELSWITGEPLDGDQGRAVFTAGSSNTRRYAINFPMDPGPQIVYGYAIDASWDFPAPNPPDFIPDDFPMEANSDEAYRIAMVPVVNTLYYDSAAGIGGGVLVMRMNVYDWQGQATGSFASEIGAVRLYSPGTGSAASDGVIVDANPTRIQYEAWLHGSPGSSGEELAIVRVEAPGTNYIQAAAPAPDTVVSAYHGIIVEVENAVCSGDANNDFVEAASINFGDLVEDQLCVPDDYRDYYWFNVVPGLDLKGQITIWCDAEPTTIGLYDENETLIHEESVIGDHATINLDSINLYPGKHYLRIYTSNDVQVAPYLLDMDVQQVDVIPDNPFEITPEGLYCKPQYMEQHGNYLFLAGIFGIWIFDVSNPEDPELISKILEPTVKQFALNYPHLYYSEFTTASDHPIGYVDVSDVHNPITYPQIIDLDLPITDLEMSSDYLFVLTSDLLDENIRVFDYTSDPTNPSAEKVYPVADGNEMHLFDPEGTKPLIMVSVGVNQKDLHCFGYANMSSWTVEGTYTFANQIKDMVSDNQHMYVLTGYSDDTNLSILHDTTSADLTLDGSLDFTAISSALDIQGDDVVIAGYKELHTVDVFDYSSPDLKASSPLAGSAIDVVLNNDNASVIISGGAFDVWDVSTLTVPERQSTWQVANYSWSMAVVGDTLIVGDSDSNAYHGIKSVDISDPLNARVLDTYYIEDKPYRMAAGNGFVAIQVGLKDILLLDVSDPANLTELDTLIFGDNVQGICIDGDAMYLCMTSNYMNIYDVTDPANPDYKSDLITTYDMHCPSVNDTHLFVGDGTTGVNILSVANPWNPAEVGSYTASNSVYDMVAIGDYLYMSCFDVFEIVDVSNAAVPVYEGSVLLPQNDYEYIACDGQFAYLINGQGADLLPVICEIWPPDSPDILYQFTGWPYHNARGNVVEHDGYLYIPSLFGIRIFDLY